MRHQISNPDDTDLPLIQIGRERDGDRICNVGLISDFDAAISNERTIAGCPSAG
jgi:hypothetical protein